MYPTLFILAFVIKEYGSEGNLALRKSTRQSSTTWDGYSYRAVDGRTNGTYDSKSCTHTDNAFHEWWEVDLFGFNQIDSVIIYNRIDSCCSKVLQNITIEVFLNDRLQYEQEKPVLCGKYPGILPTMLIVKCAPGVRGRFVRITKFSANLVLSMCEVQVRGNAAVKTGALFQPQSDISWTSSYVLDSSSLQQCRENCFVNTSCFAFEYNIQTKDCDLIDSGNHSDRGKPWVYFIIKKLISSTGCN